MGAASTAADDSRRANGVWLWNPATDLLIGCAGWSLPFLALSAEWAQRGALDVTYGFALLTLVCNHPHYMATLQRAWSDPARRGAYRFYLVHLALLLAIAAGVMLAAPVLIPAFFTAYVIWSPWHYSGQNFG